MNVETIAVRGSMAVISIGASICQVNLSRLRRLLDTGSGRNSGFT